MPDENLEETTDANVSGEETNGQGYLTVEQFDAFKEEFKDGIAKGFQATQSQTDRYQARVQQKVQEIEDTVKLMQSQGVEISNQDLTNMKNQAILDELARPESEADPGDEPGDAPTDDALEAIKLTVNAEAERMEQEAGVEIEDDDPEIKLIEKAQDGTVYEYLTAVKEAITAKQERVGKTTEANVAGMPGLSSSGTPSSNPLEGIMDPTELWNKAKEKGQI